MFDHLYRDELASLHEAGPALAARHPQLAAMLASPSDDPDVERLLQGFAFVAARLRQRIDAAAPELVEALLGLLAPGFLRPLPAATIVAFAPAPPGRGVLRVERGTPLHARAVDGTRCTFSTTRPLVLAPLSLDEAQLEGGDALAPTLTLRFTSCGDASWAAADQPLRLHLHGDAALTDQLGLWLARHVRSVSVRDARGHERLLGGAEVVRQVAQETEDDDALLPWPAFAPASTRLWAEALMLPARLRFFDLCGLARAADLVQGRFEVVLRFSRPPLLHARLPDDLVRLHCVPAVNLFAIDAAPIRADLRERPVLLRASGLDPAHMEVFDVTSVTGLRAGGRRVAYAPASALDAAHGGPGRYAVSRRASPVDDGIHTYLTLHRAVAHAREAPDETLAVSLWCSNRELPRVLGVGDVATPTAATPPGVAFANIAPISPPRRPPLGSARMWQLVGLLGCSRRGMSDAASLRGWLTLHAHGAPGDDPRIAAIQQVETRSTTRVWAGVAARGTHWHVTLDRAGFASEGEVYAFGALLHRMLALDARLNGFADLTVSVPASGTRLDYRSEPRW